MTAPLLDFPVDGQLFNYWYLKDIQPLQHPTNRDMQAFSAQYNTSEKGKVWRLGIWVVMEDRWLNHPTVYRWGCLASVTKVSNWRGNWKVWFTSRSKFWCEARFDTEAKAEAFLLQTWSFYGQ